MRSKLPKLIFAFFIAITNAFHAQYPPICFKPAGATPTVATTYLPLYACSGDFNNDGKQDFATANVGSHNCMIFLGDGIGNFNHVFTYNCNWPRALASADFNSDGNLDLVICSYPQISVVLGTGTGSFAFSYSLACGSFPFALLANDLNMDGKADLAVVDNDLEKLYVFPGTGTGTFMPATIYPTDSVPYAITNGDFDGNGLTDLAIANYGDSFLSVYYNSSNGSFTPSTFPVNDVAFTIAASDFNHDGLSDIALAGFNVIYVLLSTGTGSFSAPTPYNINQVQINLVTNDFNGDGHTDLGCSNYAGKTAAFLAGQGNGLFNAPVFYTVNAGPLDIICSDFNNDAKPDVAVVNYNADNVSILMNEIPTISITGPYVACQGQPVSLVASGAATYTWSGSFTTATLVISPPSFGTYTVIGASTYGCVNTASRVLNVISCTGIESTIFPFSSLVFPNPASTYLFIDHPYNTDISLLNAEGEIVFYSRQTENKSSIDVSSLPRGLYVLKIQNEENFMISKIFLE
jgi:hypothetical protein